MSDDVKKADGVSAVASNELLAPQVGRLEARYEELNTICGEIIATIRVNLTRGTILLCPCDPEDEQKWKESVDGFMRFFETRESRYRELQANAGASAFYAIRILG